ncbi:MAG: hypothetical protein LIP08_04245 [Bacteroides sp.]|nr:hypothetical protein [Bacteroides sp.]
MGFTAVGLCFTACQQDTEFARQHAEPMVPSTRAITDYALTLPDFTREIPLGVIPVDSTTQIEGGNSYLIDEYSGNVPFYGATGERAVLYVGGNWDVENWNLETGVDVVVMPGATINSSANSSLVVNGNSNLYVMPDAKASFDNDFLYFSNNGSLYNLGELDAKFLEINSGMFYVGPGASAQIDQFPAFDSLGERELTLGFVNILSNGYDDNGGSTTLYNVDYVPGQSFYVLEPSRSLQSGLRITDNEGFGATLSTADVLGSVRLYMSAGVVLGSDELPKELTFNLTSLAGDVTGVVKVTLR